MDPGARIKPSNALQALLNHMKLGAPVLSVMQEKFMFV